MTPLPCLIVDEGVKFDVEGLEREKDEAKSIARNEWVGEVHWKES